MNVFSRQIDSVNISCIWSVFPQNYCNNWEYCFCSREARTCLDSRVGGGGMKLDVVWRNEEQCIDHVSLFCSTNSLNAFTRDTLTYSSVCLCVYVCA